MNIVFAIAGFIAFSAVGPFILNAAETPSAAVVPKKAEEGVAARVNGIPIMRTTLDPLVDKAIRKIRKFAVEGSEEPRGRVELEELDKLIARELLFQAGMKLPKIDEKIATFQKADAENMAAQAAEREKARQKASENAGHGESGKPAAKQEVKQESKAAVQETQTATPEEEAVRSAKKKTFVINEYLSAKGALTPVVPDEDAKKYYDANSSNFFRPETVKASHILVKIDKGASEKEVDAARKKAEEARAALAAGKKFEDIAKEISACATAQQGGDLGIIKRGYMPKDFDAVAFALPVGETSSPVRTEHGFHIIKVAEKTPEGIRSFEEVKEFIKGYLSMGAREKKYQEAVNELKKTAVIEKAI